MGKLISPEVAVAVPGPNVEGGLRNPNPLIKEIYLEPPLYSISGKIVPVKDGPPSWVESSHNAVINTEETKALGHGNALPYE